MAKLSARGRTEVWRLAKTITAEYGHVFTRKYALMSDGKILKTNGHGWSVAKLRDGLAADEFKTELLNRGYAEVKR